MPHYFPEVPSLFWENLTYPNEYFTPSLNSNNKTTQPKTCHAAHLSSMPGLPPWLCTFTLLNYSLLNLLSLLMNSFSIRVNNHLLHWSPTYCTGRPPRLDFLTTEPVPGRKTWTIIDKLLGAQSGKDWE